MRLRLESIDRAFHFSFMLGGDVEVFRRVRVG